jgi:hypothetical protein
LISRFLWIGRDPVVAIDLDLELGDVNGLKERLKLLEP